MFWRVLMACCRAASGCFGPSELFCTLVIAAATAGRADALWVRSVPMAVMAAAPRRLADAELSAAELEGWPSWPRLT